MQTAWLDQIHDTLDLDVNENGELDLTGIDDDLSSYSDGTDWDLDPSEFIEGLF